MSLSGPTVMKVLSGVMLISQWTDSYEGPTQVSLWTHNGEGLSGAMLISQWTDSDEGPMQVVCRPTM